jgi:hypothetical protein
MPTLLEARIAEEVRAAVHRMNYRDGPKDRAVSRHEMAHCLASFALKDAPIRAVSISDFASGKMLNCRLPKPDGMPDDESPDDLFRRVRRDHPVETKAALSKAIMVFLAGRAADVEVDSGLDASCSRYDLSEAERLAGLATDDADERESLLSSCRASVKDLVHSGWPTIVELAALLVEFRELPGRVITTLLEERACSLREAYATRPLPSPYVPAPPDDPEDWWSD